MSDVESRPRAPYVGIRAYDFGDREIFRGRDSDIAEVCHLVAARNRWRIILLHGQTGAGKSSFLRAGLVPHATSPSMRTDVFRTVDGSGYPWFITSTADPMRRLAESVERLASDRIGAERYGDLAASLALPSEAAERVDELARNPKLLTAVLDALAPELSEPLLLIVDQAEEVFTLRNDAQAEQFRNVYFAFLAEYCGKRSWIQLLISMRTEFYGRFDNELRKRLGPDMPVAAYYLEPLGESALLAAIRAPVSFSYAAGLGCTYKIKFAEGVDVDIARMVGKQFADSGALTALQVLCSQLCERALTSFLHAHPSFRGEVVLSIDRAALEALGPIAHLLEDVVDASIGDFCEAAQLALLDSLRVWDEVKEGLAVLVSQQEGSAPTTRFVRRALFERQLRRRLGQRIKAHRRVEMVMATLAGGSAHAAHLLSPSEVPALITKLVDFLLLPSEKVLRLVQVTERRPDRPVLYLALGHDILSLGIVEASDRDAALRARAKAQTRRLAWSAALVPLVSGVTFAAATYHREIVEAPAGLDWMQVALVGLGAAVAALYATLIVTMSYEIWSKRETRTMWQVVIEHLGVSSSGAGMWPLTLVPEFRALFAVMRHGFAPLPRAGQLFANLSEFWRGEKPKGINVLVRGAKY